jgi:hypothetical protein
MFVNDTKVEMNGSNKRTLNNKALILYIFGLEWILCFIKEMRLIELISADNKFNKDDSTH